MEHLVNTFLTIISISNFKIVTSESSRSQYSEPVQVSLGYCFYFDRANARHKMEVHYANFIWDSKPYYDTVFKNYCM